MSFQRNAFQSNAFQTEGPRASVPIVPDFYSGGYDLPARKRKTKADLRREREEWGILPKKAKAIIQRVAVQHVEEPDNTEALIQAFERASVAYLQQYEALFRQEVLRIQREQEEEEIFMLLH